jgi:hypothetical protein
MDNYYKSYIYIYVNSKTAIETLNYFIYNSYLYL